MTREPHPHQLTPEECAADVDRAPQNQAKAAAHKAYLAAIPNVPCDRVMLPPWIANTEDNTRPWMAHVDGDVIRKKSGNGRRFSSAKAAYAAARKAAPRRWHP